MSVDGPWSTTTPGGQGEIPGHLCRPTVLFADIKDFTPITRQFSDDFPVALISDRLRTVSTEIVDAHGCEYREFRGDEIMACFGVRAEVEEAAIRACRAAREIQDWMISESEQIEELYGFRPTLRVGINTGPALYWETRNERGELELFVHGDALNKGKRIEGAAEPGTVVLGSQTYTLVRDFVDATPLGEFELKGIETPAELFRLDSLREAMTRFDSRLPRGLTRFLERESEIEVLKRAATSDIDRGLVAVEIAGEAGIGKSRLVFEFERWLKDKDVFVLRANCSLDRRRTAFFPFVELLQQPGVFDIRKDDDDKTVREKLSRVVTEVLELEAARHVPYLLNLLRRSSEGFEISDNAETVGIKTRETLGKFIKQCARRKPTVVIIEDLHWIDSASEELIYTIARSNVEAPILLVTTFRPEEYDSRWDTSVNVRPMLLTPLTDEAILDLVRERLDVQSIPEKLTEFVRSRSEGNPLFAEEILNFLLDAGHVTVQGDAVMFKASAERALPSTPQEIFSQRLGRLPAEPRRILEAAAVAGRWFSAALVGEIAGLSESVDAHLKTLTEQGFVFEDSGDNQDRFCFKHILILEAAYAGLVRSDRESLHAKIARCIESEYWSRATEVSTILAHHWSAAYTYAEGRLGDGADRRRSNPHARDAARVLKLAGESSLGMYSIDDAHQWLSRAFEILERDFKEIDPVVLVELVLSLARILFFKGEIAKEIALLERYKAIAESQQDLLPRYLAELGYAYVYAMQSEKAKQTLAEAEKIAGDISDMKALGLAKMGALWHYVFCVTPDSTQRVRVQILGREANELGVRTGDVWLRVTANFALAQDAVMHGNPRKIRQFAQELERLHRELDDGRARSLAAIVMSEMNALNMNYEQAMERAAEARRFAVTEIDQLNVRCCEGVAAAMVERSDEAYKMLGALHDDLVSRGVHIAQLLIDIPFGVAMVATGGIARGVRSIKRYVQILNGWGYPMATCNGHSFLGEIYTRMALREGKLTRATIFRNFLFIFLVAPFAGQFARHHLIRALACNRRFDAPSYVAWAHLNIGKLEVSTRRYKRARKHLDLALKLADGVDAHALAAAGYLQLGVLAHRDGRIQEARESYETARRRATSVGALGLGALALIKLGELTLAGGQDGEAEVLLLQARNEVERLASVNTPALLREIDQSLLRLA